MEVGVWELQLEMIRIIKVCTAPSSDSEETFKGGMIGSHLGDIGGEVRF